MVNRDYKKGAVPRLTQTNKIGEKNRLTN